MFENHKKRKEEFIARYNNNEEALKQYIKESKKACEWFNIACLLDLSEDFIKTYKDYLSPQAISRHQKLSEDFIRENQDYVHWEWISIFQNLSEPFIEEFKDKVNWIEIGQNQLLSKEFIEKHVYHIDWDEISKNPKTLKHLPKEYIMSKLVHMSNFDMDRWRMTEEEFSYLTELHESYKPNFEKVKKSLLKELLSQLKYYKNLDQINISNDVWHPSIEVGKDYNKLQFCYLGNSGDYEYNYEICFNKDEILSSGCNDYSLIFLVSDIHLLLNQ